MSARSSRKQPSSQEPTRDSIIDASMRLFAERGYDGVSIRDITSALDLTPGAIYHHFAGKKELHEQVVIAAFEQVMLLLLAPTGSSGTPRQRLHDTIYRLAEFIRDAPVGMQMVDRVIFEGDAPMSIRVNGIVDRTHGAIAAILREIKPTAPIAAFAEHILGAVYGAQKLRPIRNRLTTETGVSSSMGLADSLTEFTMCALGSAPPPLRAARRSKLKEK